VHLVSGVAVAEADPAGFPFAAGAAAVAHQLVDDSSSDVAVFQPGREGVAQVVRPAQVQVVQLGSRSGRL
jgi:hypothetical protein